MTATRHERRAVLFAPARPLAFHGLRGELLLAHALRALLAADVGQLVAVTDAEHVDRVRADVTRWALPVEVADVTTWWPAVRETSAGTVLVHDVSCPLTPAAFLRAVAARADADPSTALVAVRPVTDTLKAVVGGRIERTVDRDGLVSVTSPLALPSALLDADDPPPLHDAAATVPWLRDRCPVELVTAPSLGRRVTSAAAVSLLECLDEVGHEPPTERPEGRSASAGS